MNVSDKVVFAGVEAVVWDLDETLIGSFDLYVEIIKDLADKFDLKVPERETMLRNYHGSLEDTLKKTFGIRSDEAMADIYAEFKVLQIQHYEDDIDKHYYEDAVGLAHRANELGIRQAVVTNRAHEGRGNASPHAIIGNSKIKELIDEIRCIDQVEFPKPDARAIHDWFENKKINPKNVLVVGDQHVDAQLAINLEARAVLVTRNGSIPHLDRLEKSQNNQIFLVNSLHNVELKEQRSK